METRLDQDARLIRENLGDAFDLAVVLGSGLGSLTDALDGARRLSYTQTSALGATRVAGHGGRLWSGRLAGWKLLVFEGRFHMYEGLRASEVVRPVDLAAELGCRRILLTNAAGGIDHDFSPGDFMFIADHINLTGDNPLRGLTENPFADLSQLYRNDLFEPLVEAMAGSALRLQRGVLAGLLGPSYETPAEISMLERLGAHAVSMSTVAEAIKARYHGMDVVGLSLISNKAAGRSSASLNHAEVLAEGRKSAARFCDLVNTLIRVWAKHPVH